MRGVHVKGKDVGIIGEIIHGPFADTSEKIVISSVLLDAEICLLLLLVCLRKL